MMERTCKNCMYEYGRLLPNPCGECSFVDNDRFIPKDDEVKKMFKSEIIKFEQLSGENAEITSISRIGGFLDGYHKAMEKPQWVSCKKKLPEDEQIKWVTYIHGPRKEIAIAFYSTDEQDWCEPTRGYSFYYPIVAWMPIDHPEPYKEDGDG